MAGVRYVGAGVLASAVSMDKAYMKVLLAAAGLPVMPSVVVTARDWKSDPGACRERAATLGYPLFVKPARGGSSIGIIQGPRRVRARRTRSRARCVHDPKVLVEAVAEGAREVECGVSRAPTATPETSQPAEIRIGGDHEFYDFDAKYLPGEHTEIDIPAKLDDGVADAMRELAVRSLRGGGLSRAWPGGLLRDARRCA